MANNPYVNKVELADGTSLIDISDTTAAQGDVLSTKYFYTAAGQKIQGSIIAGDSLTYGLTDRTAPIVGVGQVGYAEL